MSHRVSPETVTRASPDRLAKLTTGPLIVHDHQGPTVVQFDPSTRPLLAVHNGSVIEWPTKQAAREFLHACLILLDDDS